MFLLNIDFLYICAIGVLAQNVSCVNLDVHHAATKSNQLTIAKELGYKLVGDNIDKGVKAKYMRFGDHCNKSIHYFHSFAVQNRVDFSFLPDVLPDTCLNHPRAMAKSLLPSAEDDRTLEQHFVTHISRILCSHMPFFKFSFDDTVEWHIKHKYYEQMSSRSVVVSL